MTSKSMTKAFVILILLAQIQTLAAGTGRAVEAKARGARAGEAVRSEKIGARSKEVQSLLKDYVKNIDAINAVEKTNPEVIQGLLEMAKKTASAKGEEQKELSKDLQYISQFIETFGSNNIRGEASPEEQKAADNMLSQIAKSVSWTSASARRSFTEDLARVREAMIGKKGQEPKTLDEAVGFVLKDRVATYNKDCG